MERLLIANRGEIAVRVARSARERGVQTVLAASEADRDSLAARRVDRTVVIGPPAAAASYLNIPLLIHTAIATGCQAVHPGFGFLSERADFADAVEEAGLVFVGPRGETIRGIGDKLGAREVARKAGVPMAAGSLEVKTVEDALEIAAGIGYPVITKASAGGGGRGMKIAHDAEELAATFDTAAREAEQAFGDGRLYLERFVERARHLEVQVFGDGTGQVVHFGERDCSIQRRHQKMVEEAPAQLLAADTRARLHEAAVALLRAIDYRGAGTVEFLYDPDTDDFFFMEVNARLQVEHPVSEEVNGIDLVDLQLIIASGEEFHWDQERIHQRGHSIEVRILAEDPADGFRPSPGRITRWEAPEGDGIRLDSAVEAGSFVPPYYDSMIAKLIVTAEDRPAAIARLAEALEDFHVEGIHTNIPLLRELVRARDFIDNTTSTRWLDSAATTLIGRNTP
ncbi:acetyl-CoA carboxylase biotin carboxylase subunit [Nocardioides sp. Soil796]|uniref:acetyl-CoA carboxylase biotin carboxylase subunit n=1 Tax=Nocardioides sp. Soil796 TaxID=1736412 RepID=UPI00070E3A60|nr:acetyl-CoA carboxylase biotin carboxylase subunit [Nocardioides sp. Soil796]KRF19900.1 acetyl-CoA carboxylase biotin carboxylase subunit [Nocardioides sp. Soil796]